MEKVLIVCRISSMEWVSNLTAKPYAKGGHLAASPADRPVYPMEEAA